MAPSHSLSRSWPRYVTSLGHNELMHYPADNTLPPSPHYIIAMYRAWQGSTIGGIFRLHSDWKWNIMTATKDHKEQKFRHLKMLSAKWQPFCSYPYRSHSSFIYISTLVVLKPEYSSMTRTIPWLLMHWLIVLLGHQQQWYWLCRIKGPCLPGGRISTSCVSSALRDYRKPIYWKFPSITWVEVSNIHLSASITVHK